MLEQVEIGLHNSPDNLCYQKSTLFIYSKTRFNWFRQKPQVPQEAVPHPNSYLGYSYVFLQHEFIPNAEFMGLSLLIASKSYFFYKLSFDYAHMRGYLIMFSEVSFTLDSLIEEHDQDDKEQAVEDAENR